MRGRLRLPDGSDLRLPDGTSWSIACRDLLTGETVLEHDPDTLLRTASIGKVFLLLTAAESGAERLLDLAEPLSRRSGPAVADSGLWQHLQVEALPVGDVARLIGYCSDNWATNALLATIGLPAVAETAARWAPRGSQLLDFVRDARTPEMPETLSKGCAADWADVFARLHDAADLGRPSATSPEADRTQRRVATQTLEWLGAGVDTSMVASALHLDPLSHDDPAQPHRLWHKTGADDGVRGDVGLIVTPHAAVSYAALCNATPDRAAGPRTDEVMRAMRHIGEAVRAHLDDASR